MGHKHGLVKSDYWLKTTGLDEIVSHVNAPNVTVLYEILMLIMFKITVFMCNHSLLLYNLMPRLTLYFLLVSSVLKIINYLCATVTDLLFFKSNVLLFEKLHRGFCEATIC